ncbi:MAG TPA: hotdog fold domain-containing protein, partial [Longimicrobiales bacterium]|nr:hotdog fold domain-containing protein [Longimicrobiales bacterium]
SPAARLLQTWNRLSSKPAGPWLFGRLIARAIPYTGSVKPLVREVRSGYARVELRDRRRVRNHLDSIHAIALANVGEFTGGLAMTATAPAHVRSILLKLEVEFLKKARGTITAECRCTVPTVTDTIDHVVQTELRDGAGDEVARVRAIWRLSPL